MIDEEGNRKSFTSKDKEAIQNKLREMTTKSMRCIALSSKMKS